MVAPLSGPGSPLSMDSKTKNYTGHECQQSDFLVTCALADTSRDGLLLVPIYESIQPRVCVKHIHPFCLKG